MPLGFEHHNHSACISDTLQRAEVHCREENLNFTPVRRRALEILLQEHRALGAYDLLTELAASGMGKQPPVAYRALDFLVSAGFAHKIERLNAYIACSHLGSDHAPAFLICRKCNAINEANAELANGRLGDAARAAGFQIERTVVEALGLCPSCQDAA
ncbi:Zinc uptake regulation protein [Ascidiaceihabitans donghaensis]|uniref:Zinc uptake regulation protein n=1 Tax=Ascidiaceihabitans donghaensis TaxID=1510460 RepID=A0A2R8BG04_9RHOB|nr:transcriptional repressor [Ascidiaceihabitans donghaensis]SPH21991.1 Zinc uptake regulation protein [Ascidiaceihabitans donghaensis]